MSFSGTVKEELVKHVPAARHCQIAELAAILHFCGHYVGTQERETEFVQSAEKKKENTLKLSIQAENEAVIRKCFTLLKKTFNINTSVNVTFSKKAAGRSTPCSILLENRMRSVRYSRLQSLWIRRRPRQSERAGEHADHQERVLPEGFFERRFSCGRLHERSGKELSS